MSSCRSEVNNAYKSKLKHHLRLLNLHDNIKLYSPSTDHMMVGGLDIGSDSFSFIGI